ncbi:MAG TPA: PH domain-containing protein, partial [Micromonosporaceae bacterium]|nr:PH domain-containing protein [Micromonosporaceae bacterium]
MTDGFPAAAPVQADPAPEPRRRLHPLSPLLHSAKSLAVIVAAISWQGYAQLGLGPFAGLVVLLLMGAVVLSIVSWFVTGYHVVGKELRVYEGVLWRRTRAIPLERLQSVEVVRPVLARLTALAELRLEVVGGSKTEAPLAYLSVRDAEVLRDRLLSLAGRLSAPPAPGSPGSPGSPASPGSPGFPGSPTAPTAPGTPGTPGSPGLDPQRAALLEPGPEQGSPVPGWTGIRDPFGGPAPRVQPPARELHAVDNRDVVMGQLLTPQVWALPIALVFVVVQAVVEARWGFIGVASTLTAMAGIVLQPARRVLSDWNFRLARDEAGLRVRHGLLETRSQTVPLDRVQAIRVTWPLLWRMNDWLRMRLDIAGLGLPEMNKDGPADNLLPVGDLATAARLLPEVLPGVSASYLVDLRTTPPPSRARWLAPVSRRRIGAALTDEAFAARSGVLTRRLALVPYARIQSVRLVQGPVQRMLGLATVYADTAAGVV